ncbi:tRNA(Arg) A34 adenosine deaminase TadA [Spinactinospora alkalitolerans]|uniref:tRNA(Arg) A34 adenosine deaminase TadA n=1 Tax=Spinactinospora alkalitolerans TaxID=687207 RepID=A0A852U2H0_9ACTN|nr:hypothetical protein [Spinactinospora alkalitolerans]NYE50321.1 tRNA(Arg) A34 adenosine deaminase TadA [Spinactinospora alkalitolerans]
MLTTDGYTGVVRQRLYETRARVMEHQQVGPGQALVGLRSDNVALTPMTLCVAVTQIEHATLPMIRDFCRHADAYAKRLAGGGVGWVSGACTIAAVVCARSDHDAQVFAGQQTQVGWGTTLRPVLVDLSTGNVNTWLGTQFVGALAMGFVRDNVRRYFPLPAEAGARLNAGPPPGPQAPPGHPGPPPQGPPHGAPPYGGHPQVPRPPGPPHPPYPPQRH